MFISEQYGWVSELSGEFFDNMLHVGYDCYGANAKVYGLCSIDTMREFDLMLIGL